MENTMLDIFEVVGELLTIKGMDNLIEELGKCPEGNRAAKHGLRLKICALCTKNKPEAMKKLASMETGKTMKEINAMEEKEFTNLMMAVAMNLVAPFLAPAPSSDGTT